MHAAARTGFLHHIVLLFVILLAAAGCSTTSVLAPSVAPLQSEKYAAIVVDANSREVLYQYDADLARYPASLTKMMTLYMLFESIDSGLTRMNDQIPVSANAARRPPSKLGLKAGQTIDVRTAVMALCVKSANDVATVVAEYLGGSEAQFAAMMTAKARQLGMNSTVFTNASGLPDGGQRTTARDMAVLAMSLRSRFPHHYHFFSNQKFAYAGKTINGHNNLLGKVPGVDGLKTGYIRASGYNLATSVGRGGRRIVAVVMGGKSAKGRDQHMQELIAAYLPRASGF